MSVEFVDELPGGKTRGIGKWVPILNELKTQPGRWAIIAQRESTELAAGTAHNLKSRKVKMPDGNFEFATRHGAIYARYIGEEEA